VCLRRSVIATNSNEFGSYFGFVGWSNGNRKDAGRRRTAGDRDLHLVETEKAVETGRGMLLLRQHCALPIRKIKPCTLRPAGAEQGHSLVPKSQSGVTRGESARLRIWGCEAGGDRASPILSSVEREKQRKAAGNRVPKDESPLISIKRQGVPKPILIRIRENQLPSLAAIRRLIKPRPIPLPAGMTMAALASNPWMPRKSSRSAPGGTVQGCHSNPPSSVRRTVPLLPEAQAMPLPTLEIPRRSAVVVESSICHWAWADAAISARKNTSHLIPNSLGHAWVEPNLRCVSAAPGKPPAEGNDCPQSQEELFLAEFVTPCILPRVPLRIRE